VPEENQVGKVCCYSRECKLRRYMWLGNHQECHRYDKDTFILPKALLKIEQKHVQFNNRVVTVVFALVVPDR
jgi:hypothetical protein